MPVQQLEYARCWSWSTLDGGPRVRRSRDRCVVRVYLGPGLNLDVYIITYFQCIDINVVRYLRWIYGNSLKYINRLRSIRWVRAASRRAHKTAFKKSTIDQLRMLNKCCQSPRFFFSNYLRSAVCVCQAMWICVYVVEIVATPFNQNFCNFSITFLLCLSNKQIQSYCPFSIFL